MQISTFEGIVDQGRIRLKANIRLPDNMKVYVIVPEYKVKPTAHIHTPKLVHNEQVGDFKMEVLRRGTMPGV